MADSPTRNANGQLTTGHAGNPIQRPRGARGMASAIMLCTRDGQDLIDWALVLWKDVDAPIEWRWKAFEWLSNRGAGAVASTQILNVTQNISSGRALKALSDEEIEKIDNIFRESTKKVIDVP